MSNAEFKKNFAKVLEKAGAKAEQVVRAGALEILGRMVEKSPVGDPSMWKDPESAPPGYVGGRFKNNWQVRAGSIDYDTSFPPDKTGSGSMMRGKGIVMTFPMGATLYISNSLAYARVLEYGRDNGKPGSLQAPNGMVRITVMEYRQIIKQVAAQIK